MNKEESLALFAQGLAAWNAWAADMTAAREELEGMLGCKVHLFLFVKVREKWGDDPERYRDWGLDFDA